MITWINDVPNCYQENLLVIYVGACYNTDPFYKISLSMTATDNKNVHLTLIGKLLSVCCLGENYDMTASSNGNIFCVTGPLWGKSTGHWWIPITKASDAEPFFMPPPLGAGGIMLSGCASVRASVRPKPEIPSFDLYMGPLVHPTNRDRFTACPSVRRGFRAFAGVRTGEIAWNFARWCIWPPSELISLWPRSVDFSNFGAILT